MFTEITTFPDQCGSKNIPGINSIDFVQANGINSFPEYIDSENKFNSAITLLAGFEWIAIQPVQNSFKYKEKHRRLSAGNIYDLSITGKVKKETPSIAALFGRMVETTFIVRVKYKSGEIKVLGSPKNPIRLAIEIDSDSNLYKIQFSGSSELKPPFAFG